VSGKDFIASGIKEGEQIIGANQVLLFNALKEE
jgi:hypothetical protein